MPVEAARKAPTTTTETASPPGSGPNSRAIVVSRSLAIRERSSAMPIITNITTASSVPMDGPANTLSLIRLTMKLMLRSSAISQRPLPVASGRVTHRVAVEVAARALRPLLPFQKRAVKHRHGLQEHHRGEGREQHLEKEIGVEPARREADGFDIPAQDRGLALQQLQRVGGQGLGRHQMAPHEEPAIKSDDHRHRIMKTSAPAMSIARLVRNPAGA